LPMLKLIAQIVAISAAIAAPLPGNDLMNTFPDTETLLAPLDSTSGSLVQSDIENGDGVAQCASGAETPCFHYKENGVRIRRSLHAMPAHDQKRYLLSVEKMMQGGVNGTFRIIAGMHGYPDYLCLHSQMRFVAWHRAQMALFEIYLAEAHMELYGNDNIAVPYWSFIDSQPSGGPLPTKSYMWGPRWGKSYSAGPFDSSLTSIVERISTKEAIQQWLPNPATHRVNRPQTWIKGSGGHSPEDDVFKFYNNGVKIGPLKKADVVYEGWLMEHWFQWTHVKPIVNKLRSLNTNSDYARYASEIEGTIHNAGHWIADGALMPHVSAAFSPLFFVLHNVIELLNTKAIGAIGADKSKADILANLGNNPTIPPFKHADGSNYVVSDVMVDAEVTCFDFKGTTNTACWKYETVPRSRLAGVGTAVTDLQVGDSTVDVTFKVPDSSCTLAGAIPSFASYIFFVEKGTPFGKATAKKTINGFTSGVLYHDSMDPATHNGIGIVVANHFGGSKLDMSNVKMTEIVNKKDLPADYDIHVYSVFDNASDDDIDSFSLKGYLSPGCPLTKIDASWITVEYPK